MNQKKLSMRVAFFALAIAPFAACDVNNTILSTTPSDGSTSADDSGNAAADAGSTNVDPGTVLTPTPSQRPALSCADLSCGPGSCVVTDGVPACECPDGFASSASACLVCTDVANGGRVELPALTKVSLSYTINGGPAVPKGSSFRLEIRDHSGATVAASGGDDVRLPPGTYDLYRVGGYSSGTFVDHWIRSFTVGTQQITVATDEKMFPVKLEFLDQNGAPWPNRTRELIGVGRKDAEAKANLRRTIGSVESLLLAPGDYVVTGTTPAVLSEFRVAATSDSQTIKLTIPLHRVDIDFLANGAPFVGKTSDLNVQGLGNPVPATSTEAGRYTFAVPAGRWRFYHGNVFATGALGVSAALADVEVSNNTTIKVALDPVAIKGRVRVNGQPLQAKGVRINFLGQGPAIYFGTPKVDETGALTATLLPGTYRVYVTCNPPGCSAELQGSTRSFEVKIGKNQPDLDINLETGKVDIKVTESGDASPNGRVSVYWEAQLAIEPSVHLTEGVPTSFLAGVYQPTYYRTIRDTDIVDWALNVTFDSFTVLPGQTSVIRRDLRLLQVGVGAKRETGTGLATVWARTLAEPADQMYETVKSVYTRGPANKPRGFEVPAGVYTFGEIGYAKPLGCFRVTN